MLGSSKQNAPRATLGGQLGKPRSACTLCNVEVSTSSSLFPSSAAIIGQFSPEDLPSRCGKGRRRQRTPASRPATGHKSVPKARPAAHTDESLRAELCQVYLVCNNKR